MFLVPGVQARDDEDADHRHGYTDDKRNRHGFGNFRAPVIIIIHWKVIGADLA